MNDLNRFQVAATLAVILFLALVGGAGLWVHAERQGAQQWRAEAQQQKDSAELAARELSSTRHALDELRGESARQRDATEALATELRTELAAQRTLVPSNPRRSARSTYRQLQQQEAELVIAPIVGNNIVWNGPPPGLDLPVMQAIQPAQPAADVGQPGIRGWDAMQATGQPNTHTAGDHQTAWASLTQDGQQEWLLLEYENAVDISKIRVYETYNPGAVFRATVFDEKTGEEIEAWTGVDPTPLTAAMGTSDLLPAKTYRSKKVKLYIDSPRVAGWNEIDAVGLIDTANKTQWAIKATASSTFADQVDRNRKMTGRTIKDGRTGFIPGGTGHGLQDATGGMPAMPGGGPAAGAGPTPPPVSRRTYRGMDIRGTPPAALPAAPMTGTIPDTKGLREQTTPMTDDLVGKAATWPAIETPKAPAPAIGPAPIKPAPIIRPDKPKQEEF